MARSKSKPAEVIDAADHAAIEKAGQATTELATVQHEITSNAQALALQFGYEGSLHPDVLEEGIAQGRGRINAELFQMGARLLLLREQCQHGEFVERYERLGFDTGSASRTMQATLRLGPNAATSQHLADLGKSKLFELLILDDEEIDALTQGESARGLKLDQVGGMSVKELRAKLRENDKKLADAKADREALDRIIGEQAAALEGKKLRHPAPDEIAAGLVKETHEAEATACALIRGTFRQGVEKLQAHDVAHESDHTHVIAGMLAQIEAACDEVRQRHGIKKLLVDPALDPDDWDTPAPALDSPEPVAQKGGRRHADA